MWLPFTTIWRPWRLHVTTLWRPDNFWWRPSDDPDGLWWRPSDDPCYDSWLPSDDPSWRHWRPTWRLDDLPQITTVKQREQVTKSTTPWRPWQLTILTDNPTDLLWRPMWLHLTTRDHLSEDKKTTLTTLTTLVDDLIRPMWRPVDDCQKSLDDIWRLHLAILIAKVENCLSCWYE